MRVRLANAGEGRITIIKMENDDPAPTYIYMDPDTYRQYIEIENRYARMQSNLARLQKDIQSHVEKS